MGSVSAKIWVVFDRINLDKGPFTKLLRFAEAFNQLKRFKGIIHPKLNS